MIAPYLTVTSSRLREGGARQSGDHVRTNPLKLEFIFAGAAALLALALLIYSIEVRQHDTTATFAAWLAGLLSGIDAPVLIVVLIGGTYVAGALAVQLTFDWGTQQMIKTVRARHWTELRALDKALLVKDEAPPNDHVLARYLFCEPPLPGIDERDVTAQLREVAISCGRRHAGSESMKEFDYRRSNRQIFMGLYPSVAVAAFAVLLLSPELGWWTAVLAPLALGLIGLLLQAARYQEKAAQGLLIHTVFLQRWEQPKDAQDSDAKDSLAPPGLGGTVRTGGGPSGDGATQAPAPSGSAGP